jgi:ABC-2 type transport system ATP-binding protein
MRVDELLRYSRAFYPAWDDGYAAELRAMFGLDPAAKIKTLSKGQKARAGLVVALAYRPELLVLDEPSSGLDPIVRRDILAAVLRTIGDEGQAPRLRSSTSHAIWITRSAIHARSRSAFS